MHRIAMKVVLLLVLSSISICSAGLSEREVTLKLAELPRDGTAFYQDNEYGVSKFIDIPCDISGTITTDLYTSPETERKDSSVAVVVDVEDTRDVGYAIHQAKLKSYVTIVHARYHPVNVIKELNDHGTESRSIEALENILLWVNSNAIIIHGLKQSVTVIGLGPNGSRLVSVLSMKEDIQHLFTRAVVEYAEYSIFSMVGLFEKFVSTRRPFKMTPAPRELLVGYYPGMEGELTVSGTMKFLEAFGNHGSRITLFQRIEHDNLWNSKKPCLLPLWLRFCESFHIDEEKFPKMQLGSWRTGINVLSRKSGFWGPISVANLLEPKAVDSSDHVYKTISLGPIRGRQINKGNYKSDAFYHIPYANTASRFQYPSMVDPWSDMLDARYPVLDKNCPQTVLFNLGHEDCLNLHIFVPTNVSVDSKLPVMVFMHGGSYNTGAAGGFRIPVPDPNNDASLYDGTVIADHAKVIVVSVNYRLGPLGFLNDGDLTLDALDGNYGMRDMVLAFEWVSSYISEFGGDPDEVTLFGESAGATGSGLLALSPMMKGLIKRNIQESGSSISFFAVDFNPRVLADQVTTEMGCRSENYTKSRECLMQRDEYDFMQLNWPTDLVPWRPGIDGVFLTEDPAITLTKPSDLDLLIGFNSDEIYIIAAAILPKFFTTEPLTADDLVVFRALVSEVVLKYPDRQQYLTDIIFHNVLQWKMDLTTQAAKESIVRASSYYVFAAPSIRQGILRSQASASSSTYVYNFDIKTKLRFFADWAYNSHAFELPYVFGEPLRRTQHDLAYNATQDLLSLQMITYWTNFAKTGDPNGPMTDLISEIQWDKFTEDDQKYLRLDFRMEKDNLESDYRAYQIELWNYLVPTLFQLDDDACSTDRATSDKLRPRQAITPRKKRTTTKVGMGSVKYEITFKNDTGCTSSSMVATQLGCVKGFASDYREAEVESFLGIPYAEPPIGDLRFMPTHTATSWGELVLDATSFMPDCPWNSTLEGQSEDCLYLNIYRPINGKDLPVMIWIHPNMAGGVGSAAYDGRRVAALGNVVVVTFNYRGGALGFLSTGGDTESPGNFGLLDQNMVLQWVQKNIEGFGGSPFQVTLFGDGYGSISAGYHAVSTLTSNINITNIIHQSGVGQLDDNLPFDDLENAQRLAQDVSCPTSNISEMLVCLKSKSIEELMTSAESFMPKFVIDGNFFRDQPKVLFQNQPSNEYGYLIAFTNGEGSSEYETVLSIKDRDDFKQHIKNVAAPDGEFSNPSRIQTLIEYEYMDFANDNFTAEQQFQRAAMDISGDKHIVAASMALANISNERFQTFDSFRRTYVCKLTSPIDDEYPDWVGSPSGSFEKLFWGLIDDASSEVEQLSSRVLAYWTSFAENRRPFGLSFDDTWLHYFGDEGNYGELELKSEVALLRQFPRPKYSSLWNNLIPAVDIPFPCETEPALEIPEVNLTNAVTVRGYADRVDDGRAYHTFRGIPYAQPPLGDLRFRDSIYVSDINPTPGESVYSATLKKPRCLQTTNGARGGYADEDCLYLDIWRPAVLESLSAPVLLWICHGGQSFKGPHAQLTDDTSCDVDGRMMALDGDLIFIKVQYRIGILGFASSEDSLVPGNAALSDLKNGLKWVFDNIESFGGSKDKVTLSGIGFGSTLAMILGGMSKSITGGTVLNVIAQSGTLNSPWPYSLFPSDDMDYMYRRFDCVKTTPDESIQCLRDVEALKLISEAGNAVSDFPFGIYIRSENEMPLKFTKTDFMNMKLGNSDNITIASLQNWLSTMPMLIGVSGAAGYHFTLEAYPQIQFLFNRGQLRADDIRYMVDSDIYLGSFNSSFSDDQSLELQNYYIPWGATDDGNEIRRSAVRYHTEGGFTSVMYDTVNSRINDDSGQTEDTFVYVFEEPTDTFPARRWLDYGGALGEEIPFMLPNLGADESSQLGLTIRQYWGTFVTRGSPNTVDAVRNRWQAYNAEDKSVMIFEGVSSRVVSGYRDQAYTVWDSVLPSSLQDPADQNQPTTPPCSTISTPTTSTVEASTCPTVSCTDEPIVVVTDSNDPTVTCPKTPVMGTGIGLELSPTQADAAIEALFGISLTLSCLSIIAVLYFFWKSRKSSKESDSIDSFMMNNEAAIMKSEEAHNKDITSL